MNDWVYAKVNIGVYRTGFATMQEAYDSHLLPLFESLDRLEEHLGQPGHSPYPLANMSPRPISGFTPR
jgi:glutathionyl-hydroquinone reductase